MTTIKSTCGKYEVNIIPNGRNAENGFLAIANMVCFNPDTMGDATYWFTVGRRYKTYNGALRQAIKQMAEHNIQLAV